MSAVYQLYGGGVARDVIVRMLLDEGDIPWEQIPVDFEAGEHRSEDYLAINPNGRVPAMDDDGFVLFESLAINQYLAKKNPSSSLAPASQHEEALASQWSIWALTELEAAIITLVTRHPNVAMFPPDEALESDARTTLDRPLKVLDAHLADRDWLIADRFTVADLNVAGVMYLGTIAELDLANYPNVADWLDRCLSRPALGAAQHAAD